jgi:hypothetical protein
MATQKIPVTFYVDKDFFERLKEAAIYDDRSLSKYIERAVQNSEQIAADFAELQRIDNRIG